jgi:hypothetical protein
LQLSVAVAVMELPAVSCAVRVAGTVVAPRHVANPLVEFIALLIEVFTGSDVVHTV